MVVSGLLLANMSIYQANMELLSLRDFSLAQRIEALNAVGEVIPSRTSYPTLRVSDGRGGTVSFHSIYDPLKESQRLIEGLELKEGDLIIILGFGLGYHVLELLAKGCKGATLLVVEADPGIFRTAMETLDLGPILRREEIVVAVGLDQDGMIEVLNSKINLLRAGDVKIIEHPPSMRTYPEYYRWAKELIKDYIDITLTNLASLDRHGWMWYENALANLTEIAENEGVSKLFGAFPGVPAVVVSAGPSLDKNVECLRGFENSVIIIVVDTALKILQRRGLRPHLVVSVDGLLDNYRHFQGAKTQGLCLVAEPMTYPDILKSFQGHKLIASIGGPIVEWVEGLVGKKGELKAGGSVSTIAFQLARRMGCDPLILVGQDLSFPGMKFYAQGTYRDDLWGEAANRFHTLEMSHRSLIQADSVFMVPRSGGGEVPTHSNITGYLRWFKYELGKTKGKGLKLVPTVINATEGGAAIQGAIDMSLSEALVMYCRQGLDIANRLRKLLSAEQATPPWQAIAEDLSDKIDAFQAAEGQIARGIGLLSDLIELIEHRADIGGLFQEFRELDFKITSNPDVIKFLEPLLQKSLIQAQRKMRGSSSSLNAKESTMGYLLLYQDMLDAAVRVRGLLTKALQRVKEKYDGNRFHASDGEYIQEERQGRSAYR
jgi:hypothetical protein